MKTKVFEILYKDEERQWVAADTIIEALQEVLRVEETDLDLMADIKEVDDAQLDTLRVTNTDYDEYENNDWQSMTFREYLTKNKGARIIAATFYEY
jgi:hypothetical protein